MASVQSDEEAIRQLVQSWMAATKAGDLSKVLSLMADDVIFMVPGRQPFGKEAFIASSQNMEDVRFEGRSEPQEIRVLGDWAWIRNYLEVTITPPQGKPLVRSGCTLTILQKNSAGNWVIARDANLLSAQ